MLLTLHANLIHTQCFCSRGCAAHANKCQWKICYCVFLFDNLCLLSSVCESDFPKHPWNYKTADSVITVEKVWTQLSKRAVTMPLAPLKDPWQQVPIVNASNEEVSCSPATVFLTHLQLKLTNGTSTSLINYFWQARRQICSQNMLDIFIVNSTDLKEMLHFRC